MGMGSDTALLYLTAELPFLSQVPYMDILPRWLPSKDEVNDKVLGPASLSKYIAIPPPPEKLSYAFLRQNFFL